MRLTSREKEILDYLKRYPLISQEDLAKHFEITRSSAAVHISNLMKKGVILGKGYVFNKEASIVVWGRLCLKIDINGDENNKQIDMSYGGFALDIIKVLNILGSGVNVISLIGNDDVGAALLEEMLKKNADVINIVRHRQKRSSRLIYNGKAIDYEENFTGEEYLEVLQQKYWVAANCHWLVIEPFFQQLLLDNWSGRDAGKLPQLCSCYYAEELEDLPVHLTGFSLLVIGVPEGSSLERYARQCWNKLHNTYLLISDGENYLYYFVKDSMQELILSPNQRFAPDQGLPYLLGGLVYGLSSGYNVRQAVRIAVGAAANH